MKFRCLRHSNWIICSHFSWICLGNFQNAPLLYWGPISNYPRGPIMSKQKYSTSNMKESMKFLCLGHWNWIICSHLSPFCSGISKFSPFILGAHILFPRWTNNEKREIFKLLSIFQFFYFIVEAPFLYCSKYEKKEIFQLSILMRQGVPVLGNSNEGRIFGKQIIKLLRILSSLISCLGLGPHSMEKKSWKKYCWQSSQNLNCKWRPLTTTDLMKLLQNKFQQDFWQDYWQDFVSFESSPRM